MSLLLSLSEQLSTSRASRGRCTNDVSRTMARYRVHHLFCCYFRRRVRQGRQTGTPCCEAHVLYILSTQIKTILLKSRLKKLVAAVDKEGDGLSSSQWTMIVALVMVAVVIFLGAVMFSYLLDVDYDVAIYLSVVTMVRQV